MTEERSEIAFFDVETTIPNRSGQGFSILEFGAILVCSRRLVELGSYSTLVRPADLNLISAASVRCNGISRDSVTSAPSFADIADQVYDILHGRIWAGHNIIRFDCVRIKEAFDKIGRPAPEPKGLIDSLALLTQRFGRRAGDMKMATLASYFGIGKQTHRSLDDVRMNLEVLKYCATVLFLESSLPDVLMPDISVSPRGTASGSNTKRKSSLEGISPNMNTPQTNDNLLKLSPTSHETGEQNPIFCLVTHSAEEVSNLVTSDTAHQDPFDMGSLSDEIKTKALLLNANINATEHETEHEQQHSSDMSSTGASPEGCSGYAGLLEPDEISLSSISACLVPWYYGSQKIELLHKDVGLQLFCSRLRVRFGISAKFVDYYGRPRLNFVVDTTPKICEVLDQCDNIAAQFSAGSGSNSQWRRAVNKDELRNYPSTTKLHIPILKNAGIDEIETEIYQKDLFGATKKLVIGKVDTAELSNLMRPGTFVDAFFCFDSYDFQQTAGLRLVAKKLIIHS